MTARTHYVGRTQFAFGRIFQADRFPGLHAQRSVTDQRSITALGFRRVGVIVLRWTGRQASPTAWAEEAGR